MAQAQPRPETRASKHPYRFAHILGSLLCQRIIDAAMECTRASFSASWARSGHPCKVLAVGFFTVAALGAIVLMSTSSQHTELDPSTVATQLAARRLQDNLTAMSLQDNLTAMNESGLLADPTSLRRSSAACAFCWTCGGPWPHFQGAVPRYGDKRWRGFGIKCRGGFPRLRSGGSQSLCCK